MIQAAIIVGKSTGGYFKLSNRFCLQLSMTFNATSQIATKRFREDQDDRLMKFKYHNPGLFDWWKPNFNIENSKLTELYKRFRFKVPLF